MIEFTSGQIEVKQNQKKASVPLSHKKPLSAFNFKSSHSKRTQNLEDLGVGIQNVEEEALLAKLHAVSLRQLVRFKLKLFFQQQKDAHVQIDGLHNLILDYVHT